MGKRWLRSHVWVIQKSQIGWVGQLFPPSLKKKNHQFSKQVNWGGIQWTNRQPVCYWKKDFFIQQVVTSQNLLPQRPGDSTSRFFELDELQRTGPEIDPETTNQRSSLWLPNTAVVGVGGWAAKRGQANTVSPVSSSPQTTAPATAFWCSHVFIAWLVMLLGCL